MSIAISRAVISMLAFAYSALQIGYGKSARRCAAGTSDAEPRVMEKMAAYTGRVQRAPPVCYNCDREGHVGRQCTQPRVTCITCKRVGHLGKFCARVRSTANAPRVA